MWSGKPNNFAILYIHILIEFLNYNRNSSDTGVVFAIMTTALEKRLPIR
jgi:hypothetical protein